MLLLVEATLAAKTHQQNKTQPHRRYKLRAHPLMMDAPLMDGASWIGRAAVLREDSKARPNGINPLRWLIVSHGKEHHLILSRSSIICFLSVVVHLSVMSCSRSFPLWLSPCTAFRPFNNEVL